MIEPSKEWMRGTFITPATTADDLCSARELMEEYARELGVDLGFQGFAHELDTLPGSYAPPRGALLLAQNAATAAGCVALRPVDDAVCEMKRLFVRPEYRGRGLARALVADVIAWAEAAGYGEMVLDTLDWMQPAITLYESFGFERTVPYYSNPLPGAIFFRRTLTPQSAGLRCREFAFNSDLYRESVQLREAVLRQPLGLEWDASAFEAEETSFHLGCFAGNSLVGTLILRPTDRDTLKMRQVAVAPEYQARGVGSALVRFSERFAEMRGYTTITAHARKTALRFYRTLGYTAASETFLEIGIPHASIRKTLILAAPVPPTGFILRPAANTDTRAIQNLIFSILKSYGLAPAPGTTDADLADAAGYYTEHGGTFHVLVDSAAQRIVGTVGVLPVQAGTVELRKMYLDAGCRGRGLGRLLLEHALVEALRQGSQRVVLETASVLREAINLYEQYGFKRYHGEHLAARCDTTMELWLEPCQSPDLAHHYLPD